MEEQDRGTRQGTRTRWGNETRDWDENKRDEGEWMRANETRVNGRERMDESEQTRANGQEQTDETRREKRTRRERRDEPSWNEREREEWERVATR